MKIFLFGFLFYSFSIYAQNIELETLYFEGEAQGATYHITYYDLQNRDFQSEIIKILQDFDKSVST
jgi:thiamine biosynthesis lipoprotein